MLALMGPRCYNGLQLQQLLILGYSLNVLAGAWARSSESTREAAAGGGNMGIPVDRCRACATMDPPQQDDRVTSLVHTELARAAKMAILWDETLRVPP